MKIRRANGTALSRVINKTTTAISNTGSRLRTPRAIARLYSLRDPSLRQV